MNILIKPVRYDGSTASNVRVMRTGYDTACDYQYCPHCGAKMDGKDGEKDGYICCDRR